jgi:hypothetical protein
VGRIGALHRRDGHAMGFGTVQALYAEGDRIAIDLRSRRPMTRRHWTRALLATEIAFISDVLG